MKKLILSACLGLSLHSGYSQWMLDLNTGGPYQFGMASKEPINFYTDSKKVMTLSTSGRLKIDSLAGANTALLYVDENGILARQPSGGGNGAPCISPTWPWSQGGNSYPIDNTAGTCSPHDFILKANSKPSVFLKTDGKLGLGYNNSSPTAPIDMFDGNSVGNTSHLLFYPDGNGVIESTSDMNLNFNAGKTFWINQGDWATSNTYPKLQITSTLATFYTNMSVGSISSSGNISCGNLSGFKIQSSSATSSDEAIKVYNSTAAKTNFLVLNGGQTFIGSPQTSPSTHTGAMLMVNGKTVSKELILTQQNWADYVFAPTYKLRSLENLEKYIKQNKHLPNVPSAEEIARDGADVAEISRIQMEKIEELTLYIIELKKEIEKIKKDIKK